MPSEVRSTSGLRVEPVGTGGAPAYWAWVLGATVAGAVALLAVYLALAPSLPASIPSHYGVGGTPNAWSSPSNFVEVGVVSDLLLGAVLTIVVGLMGSSPVLKDRFGARAFGPIAAVLALLAGAVIPVSWADSLLTDAGRWTPGPSFQIALPILVVLLPSMVLILAIVRRDRAGRTQFVRDAAGIPVSMRSAGSGPIFLCSACGRKSLRSSWTLLSPRVGVSATPGGVAYYLKCPICGEWSWEPRVGWSERSADSDPEGRPLA
jgi:hypothetical protein